MRRTTVVMALLIGLTVAPTAAMAQAESAGDADPSTPSEADRERTEKQIEDRVERGAVEEGEAELASLSAGLRPAISSSAIAEREKLEKIRKTFKDEPDVDEVQEAALQHYGIGEGRIGKYSNQASIKSIAPKVSVQYRRNMIDTDIRKKDFINYGDQLAALDSVSGNVDEVTVSGTWNLPKLIYNPEKLELASLRKLRERVLKEVTRLYYLRRRLKITFMLDPPQDASTRARKQIRIKKTEAMINAMTDGVYEGYGEAEEGE